MSELLPRSLLPARAAIPAAPRPPRIVQIGARRYLGPPSRSTQKIRLPKDCRAAEPRFRYLEFTVIHAVPAAAKVLRLYSQSSSRAAREQSSRTQVRTHFSWKSGAVVAAIACLLAVIADGFWPRVPRTASRRVVAATKIASPEQAPPLVATPVALIQNADVFEEPVVPVEEAPELVFESTPPLNDALAIVDAAVALSAPPTPIAEAPSFAEVSSTIAQAPSAGPNEIEIAAMVPSVSATRPPLVRTDLPPAAPRLVRVSTMQAASGAAHAGIMSSVEKPMDRPASRQPARKREYTRYRRPSSPASGLQRQIREVIARVF